MKCVLLFFFLLWVVNFAPVRIRCLPWKEVIEFHADLKVVWKFVRL